MKSLLVFNAPKFVVDEVAAYFENRKRFKDVSVNYTNGTINAEQVSLFFRRKKIVVSIRTLNMAITNIDVSVQSVLGSKVSAVEKEEDELINKLSSLL